MPTQHGIIAKTIMETKSTYKVVIRLWSNQLFLVCAFLPHYCYPKMY